MPSAPTDAGDRAGLWQRLRGRLGKRVRARVGVDALEARLALVDREIEQVWKLFGDHEERLGRAELAIQVTAAMAWIDQATLRTNPLVSVVVPTRDRPTLLPRAIDSVIQQSHANWELVVSDDSTGDETAALVEALDDPRVRYVRGGPSSAGAARNRGIETARGELIAYLDDDNRMHPNWLKSVVWAFEQRPDADILYGALMLDETSHLPDDAAPEMPRIWFERYDREVILTKNVADASAIAHRASVPDARYDESVRVLADWEFFLRLTADREPLMLPAVACFYHLDAENRLSGDRDERRAEALQIQLRARALRDPR